MDINYNYKSLIEIYREFVSAKKNVVLTGLDLDFSRIISISSPQVKIKLASDKETIQRIKASHYHMMQDVKNGTPVYGTNSSFGGQAGRLHNSGKLDERVESARRLSESLIFLDIGTGPIVDKEIVRIAMAIRVNMLMRGVSGVRVSSLRKYLMLLNKNLTPLVNSYGGIGASGDLSHNQRVISVLRGTPNTRLLNEKGTFELSHTALQRLNVQPLKLDPKEGLAFVNGDNFSTAYAAFVASKLVEYVLLSQVLSAMTIEVLRGSNRSFHPMLSRVRPHPGQKESSDNYLSLLEGSKLALQELAGHKSKSNGTKVQDGYSIRCTSQFEGVIIEGIKNAINTIVTNANSVSDNPLWVSEEDATEGEVPWQWVSGGNFLAMHMVEVLDTMRRYVTQLTKRNDRLLARLIDPVDNNGLPPNLSSDKSIDKCTFKGVQIQSGMYEIYSMVLATPVSTLFGIHEERNQDITSHAITSGILALKNLEILRYSLSQNMLAVAQAVDLRGGPKGLSKRTLPLYEFIRTISKKVKRNRPLAGDIEKLSESIEHGQMAKLLTDQVFAAM